MSAMRQKVYFQEAKRKLVFHKQNWYSNLIISVSFEKLLKFLNGAENQQRFLTDFDSRKYLGWGSEINYN